MWRIYVAVMALCLSVPLEAARPRGQGQEEPRPRRPSVHRVVPLSPHADIGVTQLSYDLNWMTLRNAVHPHAMWTSLEVLDDISSHGIRSVKIWLDGDPLDGGPWCWSPAYWTRDDPFSCNMGQYGFEDMNLFWSHPGIDVFTVRFQSKAWSIQEYVSQRPDKPPRLGGTTFANEPTYWIARELLKRFGDLDKTIIFADWEQDWAIQGQGSQGTDNQGRWLYPWDNADPWYSDGCWEEYDYDTCGEMVVRDRLAYVRWVIEERQRGVEMARAEFPDAILRIEHTVVLNRYPANFEESDLGIALAEEVKTLDPQPDTVSLSFWERTSTIVEALDYVEAVTGYPRDKIYVDELGEWKEWAQYERIHNEGRRAICWGVTKLNIWMWRQTWRGNNHGLFYQLNADSDPNDTVIFGDPRPGYYAVQDLIAFRPTEAECAEIFLLPPTR